MTNKEIPTINTLPSTRPRQGQPKKALMSAERSALWRQSQSDDDFLEQDANRKRTAR